jgi:hypothetical protein
VGQWGGVRGQHASVCTPGGMGYECDKGLASAIFLLSPPPFFFMASRLSGNGVERFRYLLLRSLSAALVVEPESGKELGGKTQQYERAGGREGGKEGGRERKRKRERRDKYRKMIDR